MVRRRNKCRVLIEEDCRSAVDCGNDAVMCVKDMGLEGASHVELADDRVQWWECG